MHLKENKDVDITARYQRAAQLEAGIFNKSVACNTTLAPHWIGDSDCFWSVRESRTGQCFRFVDAKTGVNKDAFDHQGLAAALSSASGETVLADNLPLTDLDLMQAPEVITFNALGQAWLYNDNEHRCEINNKAVSEGKLSPDGKKVAFVRDHNIWLRDIESGDEHALTTDGERLYVYASAPTVLGRQEAPIVDLLWSPNSQRIVTQIIDTRAVKVGPALVQHVPSDGSTRPTILNPDRRVAFADDEPIEAWTIVSIDVDSARLQRADSPPCPVLYPCYRGCFNGGYGGWDADNRHAYFIEQARGSVATRVLKFNTDNGTVHTLFEEPLPTQATDAPLRLIPDSHLNTLVVPLPATNELLWYSDRSGWAHLYLYDLTTGQVKRAVTEGSWLVRNILHVDTERRELWIQTAGRTPHRNPYYCDICRVSLETGELVAVIATDHEYIVCDQRSRISCMQSSDAKGVSPSGNYVVTTCSRVDQAPVSVLLDRNGKEIACLETADFSGLPDHWQYPEPVLLKAADHQTDIYGVVFRPSDFDPTKNYPVLDFTFGYSAPVGSFSNNNTSQWHYLSASALAELGFIVVMINNRGNEGLRDRTFNTYQDPNFPISPKLPVKYHKADNVAFIQQLAKRHNYIDDSRVGIVDSGSLPHSLAGLLVHPDFYSVGVAMNPLADTRLYCAMNRVSDENAELEQLAGQLKGKLLLIAGMLDDVVPVSSTFRIVEALQQADKDFEMLILPNLGHGASGYTTRRSWDFVVKHLLHIEPPKEFSLTAST